MNACKETASLLKNYGHLCLTCRVVFKKGFCCMMMCKRCGLLCGCSCGGDVAACVFEFDINQPSLPTLFILFLCQFMSLWPFQQYFISSILLTTLHFLTLFFWSYWCLIGPFNYVFFMKVSFSQSTTKVYTRVS